jgi:cyclic-di-GMP-binding protein
VRTAGGARYAHGQLVGVRSDDGGSFMLAQVRWLMVAASGELHAGLSLLPGLPAGLAVRSTGLNAQNERYVPAFTLGAVPALGEPQTLVLPAGWYKPKRVVELFAEAPLRARLTEVLERGIDFERVSYERA